ncbi:hypothetical protein BMR1_02g01130 [Babesia microti strain RI]|uniref:Uncharacterized protein n=1 Tax=Babesia microti (strain RI) TaxID=1133968 RepID=I7J9M8_BABMR|nr:hypothetical protein BMR1_02g01130 [Babesia microti strain RI]CCF73389.1 hypothetical protein BMR1_02g01130 [Babesia microti strain RI]|eukprot:XP_012647998.1 hypothetical protein BMR1_02g01130 [Babesia microti strain RI]
MNIKYQIHFFIATILAIWRNVECKHYIGRSTSKIASNTKITSKGVNKGNSPKRRLIFGVLGSLLSPVITPLVKGIGDMINPQPPPEPPNMDTLVANVGDAITKKLSEQKKKRRKDESDNSEDEDEENEESDDDDDGNASGADAGDD